MTEDIKIRTARPEDALALLSIYAPYVEDTAVSFEYTAPTQDEFRGRIENILVKYPYLVAERQGDIVGYAYAGPFGKRSAYDWTVESSVYIKLDCRRMGVGKALYEKLETVLKAQGILNVNASIAYTEREDEHLTDASPRFHEHMGFRVVGRFHNVGYKFGRWYDTIWMEKHLGEHDTPQPIVPFSGISIE